MAGSFPGGVWRVGLMVAATAGAVGPARPAIGSEPRAKVATASSLASLDRQIRQRAFDGKADTCFQSTAPAKADDHLTLTLDAPATVRAIAATTGLPDGGSPLSAGLLEVSVDGTAFAPVATFDAQGVAKGDGGAAPIRAIRVRATGDLGHALVVRELAIESDRVKPFEHPVEFNVICTDAPELQAWTEATARLCEQWYDALYDELPSDNFQPTDRVTLTMKKDYNGVAAAGGGRITGSTKYFEAHRDDQGAFIHETVHILQNYRSRRNPGWLVEGVADYVRFFVYEPGKAGPVNPRRAKYDASYRTTAAFLDYLARTHDREIVKKLDRAMREGTYDKALFEQLCGKPVEALNDDWLASLRQ